jgi:hypothetical protein
MRKKKEGGQAKDAMVSYHCLFDVLDAPTDIS